MNSRQPETSPDRCAIVLVASSAGGIQGLQTLLGGLDPGLPASVLVTQHLRRDRVTHIVPILSRATGLRVKLAEDGEHPRAGSVCIAPPDHHLCVETHGALSLSREGPVNYARPAADPLFESASKAYGPLVIACVLTGSDGDGARGVKAVKSRGGVVIVEDPATAAFQGMPQSAVQTGQVDFVRPADGIAPLIHQLLHPARSS
ncbi:chemotaxis protein CheB [Streptomyces durmitorensis]|uniref:protein-glutamate methylesterase n=1 Tax=Streptomyces durmitorensis TaxID=319947 RepID=A0ABY4PKV4_9ACTN|nr:chemotaxis protein CheB [Streptomyces durmitorensis]UQT53774.1 chemotaxis protein CheB [Streptomyces durmitorensis]